MLCPEAGTKERGEVFAPPVTKSDTDFHLWAGKLYGDYLKLYNADKILLTCWNRESAKRTGK